MIPRERVASGEAEAAFGPASGRHAPAPPGEGASTLSNRVPAWEDLYQAIAPEHQRELLCLAERQGVLYAHQLPGMTNGTPVDPNRQLLARILDGDVAGLRPLQEEPIEVDDAELDATQREAVAQALATPDIFLVQGPPGSGKSRVAAEILARAAARGERVLLLAHTAAAIDRVLEWVSSREVVFPLRCVDRDEDVTRLPLTIRTLTFAERARCLTSHASECARRQAESDERLTGRLRQDEPLWAQMDELAGWWTALEDEFQALRHRRSQLATEVAAQMDPPPSVPADGFPRRMQDLIRAHEEVQNRGRTALAELNNRIAICEQEQAGLDTQLHALQPFIEAKDQGRWWTPAWWRATVQGTIRTQWAQHQERRQQIQAELDNLRTQQADVTRQREEAERRFTNQKAECLGAEVARRQAELDDREAAMRREQTILQQKWQAITRTLAPESPRPVEMTVPAIQTARSAWRRQLEQADAQQAFARQWLAYLEQAPEVLTNRLPDYVNVVAATLTALARDEHFGDRVTGTATRADFDLVILEEAEQITEPEFWRAVRRAHRCVLIGEAPWPEATISAPPRPRSMTRDQRGGSASFHTRAAGPPQLGVFQRLWQHLHCDPRRLPYCWMVDQNRLCCRLRPVAPEQRQWITTEHVADFPDIELRILTVPGCQPVLAEILFPPFFSIDRAKEYIFQELEELAVQASGSNLRWLDETDRLVLRFADRDLVHGVAIDLVPGIREVLGTATAENNGSRDPAAHWQTCCLEFDRAAGWNRPRAAQWVQEHLGLRDLGRTARFDVCHRMDTNLATFVADFLTGSGFTDGVASPFFAVQGVEPNGWSTAVEFVPVPTLRDSRAAPARGKTGAGQRGTGTVLPGAHVPALPRKGGTGLEVDLADPRHRERLPVEFRSGLPNHGFVNVLEAQAVVQTLAGLVQETRLRDRGAQREHSQRPTVAVLALYPGQAELIRRVLQQEPALASLAEEVHVGVPSSFRHREADVVLLSLTRSHTHRAVSFGEGPQLLALALTRARSKLVVFGDPGTLERRSQWEGPLDHLDEGAAAQERRWIARLVHCVQRCSSDLQAAPLRQGSGT